MAFSRLSHLLTKSNRITNFLTPIRNGSYESSKFLADVEPVTTRYEKTQNPKEWEYVQRVLPPVLVPQPTIKEEYPSGWKPQGNPSLNLPYFVARSRNHMLPVYLDIRKRGVERHTVIRHIQGDIWQLEKDLRPFLQDLVKPRLLRLQVNEFYGKIVIVGDHVNAIKHWLTKRNL